MEKCIYLGINDNSKNVTTLELNATEIEGDTFIVDFGFNNISVKRGQVNYLDRESYIVIGELDDVEYYKKILIEDKIQNLKLDLINLEKIKAKTQELLDNWGVN